MFCPDYNLSSSIQTPSRLLRHYRCRISFHNPNLLPNSIVPPDPPVVLSTFDRFSRALTFFQDPRHLFKSRVFLRTRYQSSPFSISAVLPDPSNPLNTQSLFQTPSFFQIPVITLELNQIPFLDSSGILVSRPRVFSCKRPPGAGCPPSPLPSFHNPVLDVLYHCRQAGPCVVLHDPLSSP